MQNDRKDIRLQVLADEKFNAMVKQAAHDSWMSVGQYMRDIISLMNGAKYDDAADMAMIGREIGLEGFDVLREMAERRKISVREFCLSMMRKADAEQPDAAQENVPDPNQLSLF